MTKLLYMESAEACYIKDFEGGAEERAGVERCNMELLPKSIRKLRIVQVGDEICPCAGTHVKNTSEIGTLKMVKKESKGKMRTRITYELV